MVDGVNRGWPLLPPDGEDPTSWVLFQGRGYRVGAIRVPPHHLRWKRMNDIPGWPVLIFARTPVRLEPVHGAGGVVDPGCAIFLGANELHRRECLTEQGDRSDWFSFSDDFLARMVPDLDPEDLRAADQPLRFAVDAAECALQRRAFRDALHASPPDELLLEEAVCTLIGALHRGRADRVPDSRQTPHRRLAEDVQAVLGRRYTESIRLEELARTFRVTAPHLCRVFRAATGRTIHGFRERLRLAAALERLEEGESNLTELALDLGYSSHAHFATNFRRAFGVAPSVLRSRR